MGFLRLIGAVLPNVQLVVSRFPVSVLIAFLLTILMIIGVVQRTSTDFYGFALLTLFFGSVGATLFGERWGWHPLNRVLLALGVSAFLGSLFVLPFDLQLTAYMMPLALVLIVSTVAYLGRGAANAAFWQFNHSYWFTLIVAVLGSLLIAGLVSLLIGAFDLLFQMAMSSRVYQSALIIALCFIGPLIWLSFLPDDFELEVVEGAGEALPSKITGLFVRYVFVPFFLLFALMFFGLGGKVLFAGVLPAGQVAAYGTVVIIAGILTYILAYPTRLSGGALVMFFHKNWMWFLLVPLVLVGFALLERLAAYGMTPPRYYMFGFLLWASFVVAYGLYTLVVDQEFDLRLISLLAGGIIGLASFGPWGAEAVSNAWQKQRLQGALTRLGVMEDGVIVKAFAKRDEALKEDYDAVRDGLNYFRGHERGALLRSFLGETSEGLKQRLSERRSQRYGAVVHREVREVLGPLPRAGIEGAQGQRVRYVVRRPFAMTVPGKGRLLGPFDVSFSQSHPEKGGQSHPSRSISIEKKVSLLGEDFVFQIVQSEDELLFQRRGQVIGRFLLQDIQRLAVRHQTYLKRKTGMTGDIGRDGVQGTGKTPAFLMVKSLNYQTAVAPASELVLERATCWLFLPQ